MDTPKDTSSSKKVNIQTFGCQMNEYDTDKMLEVLKHENYHYTENHEDADLIILNTCSVREKAEQKVYSLMGRLKPLKQKNPNLIIGVGGCVAQQEGKTILQRDPNVNMVFGTDNLFDLPQMLKDVGTGERLVDTERKAYKQKVRNFIPNYTFEQVSKPGLKAHLAITKGCDKFCTFCIVPTTRGLEVSREPQHILDEAQHLVAQGTKEICLLGQNVNSYRTRGIDFVDLLHRLNEIKGLERIRFTSPHPRDFKEPLALAIKNLERVCEQMHLPLQAGSDRILKDMKRHYTLETYLEKVDMLRHHVPHASISTDLIVGFPGETEEDFEKTMEAVETVRYDHLYSFKYSIRPGTPAATMDNHVDEDIKKQRLRVLQDTQDRIQAEKQESMVGRIVEVMIEGPHPKNPSDSGSKTRGGHSVTVEDCHATPGTLMEVKISGTRKYSLTAKML